MVEIVVTKSSEEPGVKTLRVEVPVELVETAQPAPEVPSATPSEASA